MLQQRQCVSAGDGSFLFFMGVITRPCLGGQPRAQLGPDAKGVECHGQGKRLEAQAPLWAPARRDEANTPSRWDEDNTPSRRDEAASVSLSRPLPILLPQLGPL